MTDLSLTDFQAAAILGNAAYESRQFDDLVESNGVTTAQGAPYVNTPQQIGKRYGTPGVGWFQWTDTQYGSRHTQFLNFCSSRGYDWTSDEANYQYLLAELRGTYGSPWAYGGTSLADFRTTTNISSVASINGASNWNNAVWYFERSFENPDSAESTLAARYDYAQQALAIYRNGGSGGTPLPNLDARNDGVDATGASAAAYLSSNTVTQGSNVSLTYRVSNFGAGTAQASTTGLYWSSDTIFDSNDKLIATDQVISLNSNAGSTETVTFSTSTLGVG